MSTVGWISVLPPVIAITLAIWTRQVYLSLAAGIWMGWTVLEGWNPASGLARSIDQTVGVLSDPGSASVILFTLGIGAVIATIEHSGGVRGFVEYLEGRRWVDTPRKARLLAWLTGIVIFIESSITVLVAGAVARPMFDRFRVSREKLAYLIDSTSAAVCILLPLNAWGAYNLGILQGIGVQDPLGTLVAAIPLNFYAIATVVLAGAAAFWSLDLGPMKRAELRTREGVLHWPAARPMIDDEVLSHGAGSSTPPRPRNMIAPIAVMVLMVPVGLWITGDGSLGDGVGSTAVLWAVIAALTVAWGLVLVQRTDSVDGLVRVGLKGAGALLPLALVLLLALALGQVADELGTGSYVAAQTSRVLPPALFLPVIFLVSSGIAFATGTSWGTFAIMLPIAVPAGDALGLPLGPFVAAALSGGIFGDHASPISDTTIISSMAAATDHVEHVRTQLPYALIAATIAGIGFLALGLTL